MKKNITIFLIIYFILISTPLINLKKMPISIPILSETTTGVKSDNSKSNNLKSKDLKNKTINNKSKYKQKSNNTNNLDKEKSQIKELNNIISAAKIINPKAQSVNNKNIVDSTGYFNILNLTTGNIDHISEKDYVIGAVCAEMPPTFHPEALKAQAISAHTYAIKMRQEQLKHPDPELQGADFSADPENWKKYVTKEIAKKRFNNHFNEYWNIIESAVNDVIDIIITYNDEPIIAAYHAISSGKTEAAHNIWGGEAPYLLPIESYGDQLAPDYETTVSFSALDLQNILTNNFHKLNLPADKSKWFQNITRSESGSVLNVNFNDTAISGNKIRNLLNLRSLNFIVNYNKEKDTFNFNVKGYGHDIGLSQYGADYMAKNGASFKDILTHYYTDISFAKVSTIS